MDGVRLEFEEGALEAVAEKAIERQIGARGLRAVMEDGVITLQGIADSSVLVERALKISSVEFPNYTIKSAISVVQDFKPYS